MFSNRLVFAALAAACIAAAAGGGYLASRQNAVPAPVAATATPSTAVPIPGTTAERPVQETEAVVGDVKPGGALPLQSEVTPKQSAPSRVEAAPRATTRESRGTSAAARSSRAPASSAPATATPGTLSSTWPSSAGQTPAPSAPPVTAESTPAEAPERAVQEPPRAPEPPQKTFEELVVSADSVIGLQTESRITSETAHVEDRVEARVSRDVKVGDRVAIPAGTHVLGNVTVVERGGKFKERARLGIRFHTLVLADGTQVPISTEPIYRDGNAPANGSAQKIGGGAVGGAILGAILGGAKGAAIGATAGAAGGAGVVAAGDRSTAVVQPGTPMTVRVIAPVTITTEKEN